MTRIIAGAAKGQRLRTPGGDTTRPTSDRVREAAFSAIADWAGAGGQSAEEMLSGLSFLDLYAGSAAVALEAASRGAQPVVAVESVASVVTIARGNAKTTGLNATVVSAEVGKWLASTPAATFDVVWADPPYALDNARLAEVIVRVEQDWLAPDGLVVLERSARDAPPVLPLALSQTWQRRYGETILYFAMREPTC